MKSNYMGLWAGRTGWYRSKAMTQKQIRELPKKCRIILRENKYHKNNEDGTPRFIFAFADAETSNAICFEVEDYQDKVDELQDKVDELRGAISSILTASIHGQDACANYDSAYHRLCDIEEICTQILG